MARQRSLLQRLFGRSTSIYPESNLWKRLAGKDLSRRREWLWLALTLAGAVHLGAVAIVPGGTNRIFDLSAGPVFAYQTLFPALDVLGFPALGERENFLFYKIFAQDGQMLDGSFPDPQVRPRVRYDRWAVAGDQATANLPGLHASIMAYLVNQLPEPPLRIEMYAAHWVWDRNKFQFPWRGFNKDSALDLRLLGAYNGLTKVWTPARGAQ
jgi:hypothetical protein